MAEVHGWICGPKVYEFDGWLFEESYSAGPWPLKKDWSLRKRAGNKFYDMYEKFCDLSDEERKAYRVGGGCQAF